MADLAALDQLLKQQSYVGGGGSATKEDFVKFRAIAKQPGEDKPHAARWWAHIDALGRRYPLRAWPASSSSSSAPARGAGSDEPKDSASLENRLVNAVHGKVVTRFPPEPSGYLHIGHAKAALLNYTYSQVYGGKMLLRFDDTNPAKEKQEYQDAIVEDLKALGIRHEKTTYASDYIDFLAELMEKMIREGKAYVDDTDADTMKEQRRAGVESKCREQPQERNLAMWKEILAGSPEGQKYAVRAKIDMQCLNMCMRDPVFYRCKVDVPHHRHGTRYKAYPTYDFCCAIIDSKEGVTHALRSLEYSDRAHMYEWVLKNTGFKHVELTEFSRMNFDYTVLSKRKLTKLVDEGIVTGWDDPRMPTVRGVLRRGLTVEALKEFVMTQGASRNTNSMSWDKIWAINKQRIDPVVPRFCAMEKKGLVKVTLKDGPAAPEKKTGDLHPKNPEVGKKDFFVAREIYLRHEDCQVLKDGEEITLMSWGNCVIDKLERKGDTVTSASGHLNLEGSVKSTKYKLNWLPVMDKLKEITLRELGFLFTKPTFGDDEDPLDFVNRQSLADSVALAEPAMDGLKVGDMLQLVRGAYYIVDAVSPMVLLEIPDGRAKKVSGEARAAEWQGSADKGKGAKEKGEAKKAGGDAKGGAGAGAKAAAAAKDRPLDDVSRLNVCVGKITKVWPHPDAEKLWCEEIDVGGAAPLSVCSGLRDHFSQEQMQDRLVVLIANMKPRKMRGVESQGMVLCSTSAGGKVELLEVPKGAKVGERVGFKGFDGAPDDVLNEKTGKAPLEVLKPLLHTDGKCVANFKDVPFMTSAGPVTSASNKDSPIG